MANAADRPIWTMEKPTTFSAQKDWIWGLARMYLDWTDEQVIDALVEFRNKLTEEAE